MPKVWITEKPSAAADLGAGMCLAFGVKSQRERNGTITLTNGDVIVPLAGHVLSPVRLGHYLSPAHQEIERTYNFDRYNEFLPVLPRELVNAPRMETDAKGKATKKPFAPYEVACRALKDAKQIVHAGDMDPEGQLIVDELLIHLGIDPRGRNVFRFGTASNRAEDIAAALKLPLDKNGDPEHALKYESAKVRQLLDFVWGMNLSIAGQVMFKNPRISAGRVQTPVLAMVAHRDNEIDNFKPVTYYVPVVTLSDGTKMRWDRRAGAEGEKGFDLEGRITDEGVAQMIVSRIRAGLSGHVSLAKVTDHREKPPLPFSAGTLLSAASRELSLTLDEVQEAASSLNRKHKAISYVGTDCKFLPTSMHGDAPVILRALARVFPKQAPGANATIKSPAFNDAKVDEHFAIVPTGELPANATADERGVFRVVAKRFIAQFYPDYVYRRTKIEGTFGADTFVANARQDVNLGWKEVETEVEVGQEVDGKAIDRDKDQPDEEIVEVHG